MIAEFLQPSHAGADGSRGRGRQATHVGDTLGDGGLHARAQKHPRDDHDERRHGEDGEPDPARGILDARVHGVEVLPHAREQHEADVHDREGQVVPEYPGVRAPSGDVAEDARGAHPAAGPDGREPQAGEERERRGDDHRLDLGLVTFAPDDLDWDDEIRLAIEERASLSPDALTGMEASLRFAGKETLYTKIFGRLSAWQNWIFNRPNAVGEKGALKRFGSGSKPDFDWERV